MSDRVSLMSCSDASLADSRLTVRQSDNECNLETRFIIVGKACQNNRQLQKALINFKAPVLSSEDGLEYANSGDNTHYNIFVLDDFMGGTFHVLRDREVIGRMLGPTVIVACSEMNQALPKSSRPLYCQSMKDVIICFTGFKSKTQIAKLADLVHYMGGSIRKDLSSRVTHLVAKQTGGVKYNLAVSLGMPILIDDWIHKSWEQRDDVTFKATDDTMMTFKMSTFYNCCLTLLGFPLEELKEMHKLTVENGGTFEDNTESGCTHVVIEEHNIKMLPFDLHPSVKVVKSEWFWGSIQMEACAEENMYSFEQADSNPKVHTPSTNLLGVTPKTLSGSRNRKRKLLRENLAHLASEGEVDSPYFQMKRRSSEYFSSSSIFDHTLDTSVSLKDTPSKADAVLSTPVSQMSTVKVTPRQQVVMELLHTETNYVTILHTVLELFKKGIEDPEQRGGPLLDPMDVKDIFGTIPSIYAVHCKIREELEEIVSNWRDDRVVGNLIIQHAEMLMKAYPPFVNFFERTKATIDKCDKENARFHAFLMKCRSRPECGRQSLTELLIRPVQRLPSVSLLLNDVLKHTKKDYEDHILLNKANEVLKEVMKHINEDKRKTEGQVAMFDIVNDIDNCPPILLSSHRNFVTKVDCMEVTDTLSGKGDNVTLFLFSDIIEMCKRRSKGNFKSPAVSKTPQKAYKHIELMSLSSIKRVIDIQDTEECKNVFALVCRSPTMTKEVLFTFAVINEDFNKDDFLRLICKYMADSVCRTDYENLLASMEAKDLDISLNDINNRSKVSRFSKRVSRAFSLKQTPRKLKRAMSSISQVVISPFVGDQSSNHSVTSGNTGIYDDTPVRRPSLRIATAEFSKTNMLPPLGNKTAHNSLEEMNTADEVSLSSTDEDTVIKSIQNIAENSNEILNDTENRPSANGKSDCQDVQVKNSSNSDGSPMFHTKSRAPLSSSSTLPKNINNCL